MSQIPVRIPRKSSKYKGFRQKGIPCRGRQTVFLSPFYNLLYLLKTSQIQCLCGSQRFGLSGCLRVSSHKFLYFFSEVSQNLSQKPNLGHSCYFPLFDGIVSGKEDVPHTSDCCTLICFYSAVPRISPQSPVFYDYAMLHNVHLQSPWRSCPFPLSLPQGPDGYRC